MRFQFRTPLMLMTAMASLVAAGQSHPYRGLWVGQVNLSHVNEVPVPLNESNVPIAPDPKVATPTSDQAQLRLILHVSGSGQVTLLRDVAVVNRRSEPSAASLPTSVATAAESSDLVLVTDPGLYGQFPPQPAFRVASAVFDFGDPRATEAMDELVKRAVDAAAASVAGSSADFTTASGRTAAQAAAAQAAKTAANPVITEADASKSFDEFMRDDFTSLDVNAIADAANPTLEAQDERADAIAVRDASFLGDTRAVEMVDAVVATVVATSISADKRAQAQNMASAYADVEDRYHRFLAGKVFGDMMLGGATAAAQAATTAQASNVTVRLALNGNAAVIAARAEAIQIRVARYSDTRATRAVEVVLEAILTAVFDAMPVDAGQESVIEKVALDAGRRALADNVARYPVSAARPSPAYNAFVVGQDFAASPQIAADAAAEAAVLARANDALFTQDSLKNASRIAAVTALRTAYSAAARALLTELPLTGSLVPGLGDPRLSFDIKKSGGSPLGPPALTGEIILPANHPTNPFRHRQNPDHRTGYDLTRSLRFDCDAVPAKSGGRPGFGVDRLTGVYREEIHGLHKPLGPNRDTGLRAEGRFELRRISLIDALNAR